MAHFWINQFEVDSELELPCNPGGPPLPSGGGMRRLVVRRAASPLDEFPAVGWLGRRPGTSLRSYDVGLGVLVCLDNLLRIFVARDGSSVTLEFDAEDPWGTGYARACTVNLAVSLCTLFQEMLPLHGAAVDLDGKRVGVIAPSGSGKTTLLWSLLDTGAVFASDDVIPVWTTKACILAAPAGGLHAKLSGAALEERGMDPSRYEAMLPDETEFWLPVAANARALDVRPLHALFVLQPGFRPDLQRTVFVRRMLGGSALALLMENTQGLWAICGMLDGKRMLSLYEAVLQCVPIYALGYSKRREVLPELARVIRDTVEPAGPNASVPAPQNTRSAVRRIGMPGRRRSTQWRPAARASQG